MKTNYIQFKQKLEQTGKTYFTLYDLQKFYHGSRANLKVLLSQWTNKGNIKHLGRGIYTFIISQVNYLQLATSLDATSYVSFEYALYYHQLIDQVPSIITLATKKRHRLINMEPWIFEYTKLKDSLFFGYELRDKTLIATPEKALADTLYLIARGKRLVELDTLAINRINKKIFKQTLKKFPQYAINKAKELEIIS